MRRLNVFGWYDDKFMTAWDASYYGGWYRECCNTARFTIIDMVVNRTLSEFLFLLGVIPK